MRHVRFRLRVIAIDSAYLLANIHVIAFAKGMPSVFVGLILGLYLGWDVGVNSLRYASCLCVYGVNEIANSHEVYFMRFGIVASWDPGIVLVISLVLGRVETVHHLAVVSIQCSHVVFGWDADVSSLMEASCMWIEVVDELANVHERAFVLFDEISRWGPCLVSIHCLFDAAHDTPEIDVQDVHAILCWDSHGSDCCWCNCVWVTV